MLSIAILAGGLGTRLLPATAKLPKSLIPVNGEPFLAWQLRLLASKGIERVVLCLGYRGGMIEECVEQNSFELEALYSYDGPSLLGTAGAIANARSLLGSEFFTLYGDSYLDCSYAGIERIFRRSGKLGLMTSYRGVDYGLSVFRAEAFDGIVKGDSLNQIHQRLQDRDELVTVEMDHPFQEIGSLAGIKNLSHVLHSTVSL